MASVADVKGALDGANAAFALILEHVNLINEKIVEGRQHVAHILDQSNAPGASNALGALDGATLKADEVMGCIQAATEELSTVKTHM